MVSYMGVQQTSSTPKALGQRRTKSSLLFVKDFRQGGNVQITVGFIFILAYPRSKYLSLVVEAQP